MGKLRLSLLILALGLITLFPPWVLTRSVSVNGDGFWALEEWRGPGDTTYGPMVATQEIGRLGHRPLWAFTGATSNPLLLVNEGRSGEPLESHALEIPGLLSVGLDIRLLLTEYVLVLVCGVLWMCWGGRKVKDALSVRR